MLIQEEPLQHWLHHFYGYGSWQAPIWFVAFEDGGGDLPEEVAERLNYFHKSHTSAKAPTLCDIRELYKHVTSRLEGSRAQQFKILFDFRFGSKAIQHGIWKNLIAFAHGYQNKKLPNVLNYQKISFSGLDSQEAWIQLFPLPSPHNHAWYYSWLDMPNFGFLKSRNQYQQYVYPNRIRNILQNLVTNKPAVVLMYGMENITMLKNSVQDFFPAAKFKSAKSIKLKIPQHHITSVSGTKLIITTQVPALRHNRIETGFDWQAFGQLIRMD